jgi:peptide/nickel transport system ATP-binding protein
MMAADRLLEVDNLDVSFPSRHGEVRAVRGVSFTLGRERLGIVGESGSGKSTTGRALLGLLPRQAVTRADRLAFSGTDLRALSPSGWRAIRGRRMAMVMQDPKFSLNPIMRVGQQIAETYRLHRRATRSEAQDRAVAMLEAVQIRDARRVADLFPHQLSGGMGQRVMIAMMLIAEPDVLIADEATSALDVTVQNSVLAVLDRLVSERGMGLVFISHNLSIVSSFCDRVMVMYGGRAVETLAARDLPAATHPYTRALLAAAPSLDQPRSTLAVVKRDPAWLL